MPLNSALSLLPGGNLSVLQQKPSPPYAEGLIPSHVVRDMVTRPLLLLLYLHLTLNYWVFSIKLQASYFLSHLETSPGCTVLQAMVSLFFSKLLGNFLDALPSISLLIS